MNHNSKDQLPVLGIVVPCYKEELVLPEITSRLSELLGEMANENLVSPSSCIWFVDDGSPDNTWKIISEISRKNTKVRGIRLTRNRGHQNALMAGLLTAKGDVLVSIDADLQDDISVIKQMMRDHIDGKDIVYGVRSSRTSDSWFKRTTAEGFYRLLKLIGVEIIYNHADFRLMSRRALNALNDYGEVNLFLRGIVPTIGFPSSFVEYERGVRHAGNSKYPLRRMLELALNGITSFSVAPLRIISGIGFLIFLISILLSAWVLWTKLFSGNAVPGWASSVLPMYLLGGIQLLSLGVIGEYVAKIYMETKRRPRFIIEEII